MKSKHSIVLSFLLIGLFVFPNNSFACKVLVDLNTFKKVDINSVSTLKCDGVWAILVNSDLTNTDWTNVYTTLGAGWNVSEDNPGGHTDYDRIKTVAGYVNAAMCYNETFIPPVVGSTKGIGGTILTPAQIQEQSLTHGGSVIVLTRSYEANGWSDAVDASLKNPMVSGVVLECYPNRSPLYLDSLRVKELISACMTYNKNFYFLSPGYLNYTGYMKSYMNLLINEGVDFSNDKIFLVAASYDFIAPFIGGAESVAGVVKYYLSIKARFASPSGVKTYNQDNNELKQNFPNPFNTTTTINYSIHNSGLVKLKIYSLFGKEVASLVDEQKTQGSYAVKFNASNLPHGIYFYKLETGSYINTKQMILL